MNNVNAIELYLLEMTIDSIIFNNSTVPSFTYTDTILRASLSSPININDTVSLKIYYHGHPQEDPSGWGGFYFSSDSVYAYNLGVGFETEPHSFGRAWFPCVDDFIDRSTYDCYIRVEDTKTAVCGGTLMSETNNGDGTKTYYWRLHSTIPNYLASVAVSDYVSLNDTFNGMNGKIPVNIYVPASDSSNAKASFVHLLNILSVYESRFGPYIWERVGYVGVPFNSGAMEHATNIAYPLACINGNLTYEYMYAHELSHHWFGDLVTCATEGDMWLNEGWATYCESLYREGIYGHSSYSANIISNHYNVLNTCNVTDHGYYAIYGVPSNLTYGSTVYDKGADVIYTLRNYLGDSTFFSMLKAYTASYKFKPISTLQFRDFITAQTGINMNDFFDGWVLSPGFPQYSIDSMKYTGTGNDYTVFVKQRLRHKPSFINSNKIEITFMSSTWQKYTQAIQFSGQFGNQLFHLPFAPVCAMMDLDEKVSDATTDYSSVIKTTGTTNFTNSFFELNVQNVTDSAFFHVRYNWVPPDPLKTASPDIYRISTNRYWTIDGLFPSGFKAKGSFSYDRSSTGFEDTLLITPLSTDSIVLLYRVNPADDWHIVSFIRTGSYSSGDLIAQDLQKGEYTFGIGSPDQSGINKLSNAMNISVFPNPTTNNLIIEAPQQAIIEITNIQGQLLQTYTATSNKTNIDVSAFPGGVYIVEVKTGKGIEVRKFVKE
jgi:aminopeptidase N